MSKSTYPGHVLKLGSHGAAVQKLQHRLNEVRAENPGDDKAQPLLKLDGDFGANTEKRVTQYQAHHALLADGEAGPQTWATLFGEPLPPKPKKTLAQKAFANAVELIGVMEVGGNNTGPMVTRIIQANGGAGPEPWCGDFVAYCYRLAGSDIVKGAQRLWAYVPWISRTNVTATRNPVRGDLVRFDWNRDGVQDHVGLFDSWVVEGSTFRSVEGNTGKDPNVSDSTGGGDGVHRRVRPVSLVTDFLHVRS